MKGKQTGEVIKAMEKTPKLEIKNLTSDKGSEFISTSWKKLMQEHNIQHILADKGDHRKMGMIEIQQDNKIVDQQIPNNIQNKEMD